MADIPTVAEHLEDWLVMQKLRLQPSTWASYRGNVERYLVPHLGEMRLDELTERQLSGFYAELLRSGGHKGKPLSPRTVRFAHAVLRKALQDAFVQGLLDDNPCEDVSLPRRPVGVQDVSKGAIRIWNPEQVQRFLGHVVGDPLRDVWVLAIGTGMRRGELLGLGWDDVDREDRAVHVRRSLSVVDGQIHLKPTKNTRARSLHYDDRVAAALDRRAAVQRRSHRGRDERQARWDLVFTGDDGEHLDPDAVTRAFRDLVRELPLPVVRLHDLRHTHASLMLAAGVPVQVVSHRLGHTDIETTLRIYAHTMPAMDEEAVAAFADHVWRGG